MGNKGRNYEDMLCPEMAKHSEEVVRHLSRNDACWCGSGKKYKACHAAFDDKLKKYSLMGKITPDHSILKTPEQIEKIKESAVINVAILDRIEKEIHEGMPTSEIDKIVYDMSIEAGAIPAPLNYEGYPYSVCTSVNEQVCHGFPSDKVILKSGDIVNVDCSTILNGFFSDSSRMFCIGEVSEEKKRLVQITKEACYEGLKYAKPWGYLGDVGQAVHDYCYDNGYTIVREIGGHGVGLEFHEDPWVGYHSKKGTEMLLVPGMIFTIEPMVNMGKEDIVTDKENGWEVSTKDGMPSAQWEIMVLITEDGNEVLSW
jgi:methionyl aminopeptidase